MKAATYNFCSVLCCIYLYVYLFIYTISVIQIVQELAEMILKKSCDDALH